MKHKYLFLFIISFLSAQVFSQTCPDFASVIETPTEIVIFTYENPGPDCGTRPSTITIDGSTYELGNCDSYSSTYTLTSGSGVVDSSNFSVSYGSSTCDYSNNILPVVDFKTSGNEIRLFPNPITNGNYLNIDFGSTILSANVSIYSVTGKQIQNFTLNNLSKTSLNISGLTNGVYLLKISSNFQSITRKFVVMK